MLRALLCRLGFHRYEWFTVATNVGYSVKLETFGCRLCCDRKVILVDSEVLNYRAEVRR